MNDKVDVLAVMSRIEEKVSCSDFWDVSITDLLNARDAVANLIEAVDRLFGADMEYCMEMDGKEDQLEAVRFAKSALARVKGD